MDGLRWLLLLFGLLVIAGVYLYSWRGKAPAGKDDSDTGRLEPGLDPGNAADAPAAISSSTISADSDAESAGQPAAVDAPQKIVTVRIVAREERSFSGGELILCMRGIGLRHGKFGIFHRYDGSDEERTIFSVASLIEPGSFDLQNINGQEIPGISLFLVLPGPIESVEAFDMMLSAARVVTQSLDGELLDESGSSLSIQRERYLREEIIQFQHSNQVS